MRTLFFAGALAVLMASCAGGRGAVSSNGTSAGAKQTPAYSDVSGRWIITDIALSDKEHISPSTEQTITFEGGRYMIRTNCNSISGEYTVKGDSISLSDGAMTMMACEDMAVEDALRRLLPEVATVYVAGDSAIRLDSRRHNEYISLRRAR